MSTGPMDQTPRHDEDDRPIFPVWEEEDLFARDFEGRLIRTGQGHRGRPRGNDQDHGRRP